MASSFYIIKSGSIELKKKTKLKKNLENGQSFGKKAFSQEESLVHNSTAKARTDVKLLALSRDDMKTKFGDYMQTMINKSIVLSAIKKNEWLK